ncbi:hypothetical protein RHCRD62_70129 [Rhodococcus sp. RD6.2]|nr:hypothetical protein RHCRD62_70129 [Rhodococcus sp. RD6.2]
MGHPPRGRGTDQSPSPSGPDASHSRPHTHHDVGSAADDPAERTGPGLGSTIAVSHTRGQVRFDGHSRHRQHRCRLM